MVLTSELGGAQSGEGFWFDKDLFRMEEDSIRKALAKHVCRVLKVKARPQNAFTAQLLLGVLVALEIETGFVRLRSHDSSRASSWHVAV